METINQIKQDQQQKISELFNELGIIFAFSDSQFEKNRKAGTVYVNGGAGMLIPKENVKAFKNRFDQILKDSEKLYRKNVSMDQYILDRMRDHETFYTGDYPEILEMVREYYPECTIDDMRRVFRTEMKNQILP